MKNKTGNPLFHKLLLESTFVGIDQQTVHEIRLEQRRSGLPRADD